MTVFGTRLRQAMSARGPVCVGIDAHPELLRAWDLPVDVGGLRAFVQTCVEAFAGTVALVKPQVAFFERFGSSGFRVLEDAVAALQAAQTLVLADAKRGDIGSTMAAYAQAWLGEGPLACDAVTVAPYVGFEALRPVLQQAAATDRGVFVLAATSNPEAAQVQCGIAQQMVDAARAENGDVVCGSVGVVVGATAVNVPDLQGFNGPVLMPGLGAQGGDSRMVAQRVPQQCWPLVLPSVSRDVLAAGNNVAALRQRVAEWNDRFGFLRSAPASLGPAAAAAVMPSERDTR